MILVNVGITVVVRDVAAAVKYYTEHFGATQDADVFQSDTYQPINMSGSVFKLVREDVAMNLHLQEKVKNEGLFVDLTVEDLDEMMDRLPVAAHCQVLQRMEKNQRSATKNAIIKDSFGIAWQLIQATESQIFSKRYKEAEQDLKRKLRGNRV